jgi:putative NADH-flavin reductase
MPKVALVGASGNVGSRILKELSDRGHSVTAISRSPERIAQLPNVRAVRGDVREKDELVALLRGHDVVISALRFAGSDPNTLIDTVRAAGVKRYLVVGGAASLEVAPGKRLLDQPEFPALYKNEATKGAEFLALLQGVTDLEWTFLSPSAAIVPGERTGRFRLGTDQLLTGPDGSSISFEDYAVALVDELEKPAHVRARFTVGY